MNLTQFVCWCVRGTISKMQTVTAELIKGKRVLLRLDTDVPEKDGKLKEDFRLKAAVPTLKLCLENATQTIICGHLGRPEGKEDLSLSIAPVAAWIKNYCLMHNFPRGELDILENLRFNPGEESSDVTFSKELASLADVFVNESFAAHHAAASTTVVPTLIPSFAGLRFRQEVEAILRVRNSSEKPLIALIGGAKTEDKYPVIKELAKFCETVLVGGLLPKQIKEKNLEIPANVILGETSESGLDLSPETIKSFSQVLSQAKEVIWAGTMGKYEVPQGNAADLELAKAVIKSGARSIIGGGDTTAALDFYLDKFSFVSTGGGAFLELLVYGTLPTIEVLSS